MLWLGAANDVIFRKRGVEFVDGTAPGFAAIVGAAPDSETAARIALELQEKNLYVFMCAEDGGKRFAEQLVEAGVQVGWPTRLVPFGPEIYQAVFAIGFACRVAMAFGGIKPGDFRKNLIYNKDRTYAFVMALGEVTDEWYANAAGAINWGFPTIADTPIPQVLPTGICTYEHVVSNVPHDQIVARGSRGARPAVQVAKVPIPVSYGPAFEGERVRGEDIYFGDGRRQDHCGGADHHQEHGTGRGREGRGHWPRCGRCDGGITAPLCHGGRGGGPRLPGGFRTHPGETEPPSDQPGTGGHAHRPAGYRVDTDIESRPSKRGSSWRIMGRIIHAKYHQDFRGDLR